MNACRIGKHGLVSGAMLLAAFANPANAKLLLDSYSFDIVSGNSSGSVDSSGVSTSVEVDLYTLGNSLSDPGTLAEVTTVSRTENGQLYLSGGGGGGAGLIVNGAVTVTYFKVTDLSPENSSGAANLDPGNPNSSGNLGHTYSEYKTVIDFAKNVGSWASAKDVLVLTSRYNSTASPTMASTSPNQQAGAYATGSLYAAATEMPPSLTISDVALPEPASLALLAAGTLAMGFASGKRKT